MAAVAEDPVQPQQDDQKQDNEVEKRIHKIESIEEFNEKFEALKAGKILVDFTATWCVPCQAMKKELIPLMSEYTDFSVFEVDIDLDENEDVVDKYGPKTMPTLVFIKNGEEIAKEKGFKDKAQLEGRIKQHFYDNSEESEAVESTEN